MSNRTILGVMGVAVLVLVAAGAYLAFFAESGVACATPGCISVNENCSTYRISKQRSADIHDDFVLGVVDIGIIEGYKPTEIVPLLRSTGTAAYVPIAPYRQAAFVCVQDGFEQEWVDHLKTFEWVEWAHVEGVTPINTLDD